MQSGTINDPLTPSASITSMVTVEQPGFVGVPEMVSQVPDNPSGKPFRSMPFFGAKAREPSHISLFTEL